MSGIARVRLGVVGVACAGALTFAPVAAAQSTADPLLDPVSAEQLATLLTDSTEAQPGVCYGWSVEVIDGTGGPDGPSVGSTAGVGRPVADARECRYRVEFRATITYTAESSESDDSASYEVSSTPDGPTTADLQQLQLFTDDDLRGDDPDAAVVAAVSALPRLATSAGIAPPIAATPAQSASADAGALSDSPGSDFWRRAGGTLVFGIVALLAGVTFLLVLIYRTRRAPTSSAPLPPAPPQPGPRPR